jgi:hypothetical protein
MLLIIPGGLVGKLYCRLAMRIRTVIMYTGKDSREMAQLIRGEAQEVSQGD